MSTLNIILLSCLGVLVIVMTILVISVFSEIYKSKRKDINDLNNMRKRISFLIDRHIEDNNLNKYVEEFPDIKDDVEAYQKARDEYYGINKE